ncbi:hypothetical protein SLINC_7322 [Streptomyces lincolnensis]|uniref:Uncharacterized protein n=1 Tax=Streptomyces lincolnensis TaxID=1915 RepID=A0A1B1MLS0_STRLN|nr:hypothetical protein [Streptomyces lincolnensis]ANS69546.1 hypothetical protein SLINC_7322 [Streptomyces lincolnensis]AXG58465.1 hypothetical protein SLCG_7310 [Streptomyces lincolnensis]QMV11108.1 hypothetical protein GJU35_39135 [Streptomyces lincolnensis]
MARDGARPAYDPAGPDTELRAALQEVRTGRWMSMRTLLEDTATWWQWTQRTQVLAAAAAGTDVVRAWLAEDPHSVPAAVMQARVAVERALRARREEHRRTHELWIEAWDVSDAATRAAPHDPVPWVCLLALAQLDRRQLWEEHRVPPPEPMLPAGPWGLLAEADKRDPHNREAHHRVLQFLYAQAGSERLAEASGFAHWVADTAPPGSALHVLPLYVRVERYRRGGGQLAALDLHWVAEDAVREAEQACVNWFERSTPVERTPLDLNHLAHALWGALRFEDAARVFDALGPYYTPLPWAHRTADPGDRSQAVEVFLQARARSRSAAHDPDS